MTVMLAAEMLPQERVRRMEPMSQHTSWRVGGPADLFFQPQDLADLCSYLRQAPNAEPPALWLGLGSNLLVRDGGIPGLVICLAGRLTVLQMLDDGNLRVESGVTCARLARYCADAGLAGGEFFAGIPGTLGGALAMNAGAHDGNTWEQVAAVETIDRFGVVRIRQPAEFEVGYRSVKGVAGEWFVAAHLRMISGTQSLIREQMREILRWRKQAQPLDKASAGSVFRNPTGDHAARLIEAAGLKGSQTGGAMVSPKHANFIVNDGTATATDIETLINRVRQRVQQVHGVELKLEVHIVGVPVES